jgi:hypothetical protein
MAGLWLRLDERRGSRQGRESMATGLGLALMLLQPSMAAPEFATFSKSASLIYITETARISLIQPTTAAGRRSYGIRYTWQRQFPATTKTKWIDSAECPVIDEVIASMNGLEMPHPTPYGVGIPPPIVVDGTTYSLTPSSYSNGQLTISSNIGSPLAAWIDDAFAKIASCLTRAQTDAD